MQYVVAEKKASCIWGIIKKSLGSKMAALLAYGILCSSCCHCKKRKKVGIVKMENVQKEAIK